MINPCHPPSIFTFGDIGSDYMYGYTHTHICYHRHCSWYLLPVILLTMVPRKPLASIPMFRSGYDLIAFLNYAGVMGYLRFGCSRYTFIYVLTLVLNI